jgi:quercetin dioxygenase-like cupin family protein
MTIRRVVAQHDSQGKAVVASDGPPVRGKYFTHTPGFAQFLVWATEPGAMLPHGGPDPTPAVKSLHPEPGGTRFILLTIPPDSVMADPSFNFPAAIEEHKEQAPGIVDRFEPDCPGMHTTDTVDFGVVLEGEIWLELDHHETVHLRKHDLYVLNGIRHAWRNKGDKPATFAVVLLGAKRQPGTSG